MTVTAERRSERASRTVPLSVTAISGETLEKFGDFGFSDYAHTIPNLSFGTGSDFGVTNGRTITIRGITGGRYRNGLATTSFYIDDTPVPLALDPRVLDLERIEVLRGPQGTLFGSSAMGGTVRIITKAATPQELSGGLDVQGFDINHGGARLRPLRFRQRAAGAGRTCGQVQRLHLVQAGHLHPRIRHRHHPRIYRPRIAAAGEQTHVGSDTEFGGMLSLTYTPAALPGLTVTPMAIYQSARSNGLALSDFTPDNLVQVRPLDVGESTYDAWSFESLTIKYAAPFGTFISSTTGFHRKTEDNEDGTEATTTVFGQNYATPPLGPDYLASPAPSFLDLTAFTQELRFESTFAGPPAGDRRRLLQSWHQPHRPGHHHPRRRRPARLRAGSAPREQRSRRVRRPDLYADLRRRTVRRRPRRLAAVPAAQLFLRLDQRRHHRRHRASQRERRHAALHREVHLPAGRHDLCQRRQGFSQRRRQQCTVGVRRRRRPVQERLIVELRSGGARTRCSTAA